MAIATCKVCRNSFNGSTCPMCGETSKIAYDEDFRVDLGAKAQAYDESIKRQEEREAEAQREREERVRAHQEWMKRPLEPWELSESIDGLKWSISACRNAPECVHLKELLSRALDEAMASQQLAHKRQKERKAV